MRTTTTESGLELPLFPSPHLNEGPTFSPSLGITRDPFPCLVPTFSQSQSAGAVCLILSSLLSPSPPDFDSPVEGVSVLFTGVFPGLKQCVSVNIC